MVPTCWDERPAASLSLPAAPDFDLTSVAVGNDSLVLFGIRGAAIGSDGAIAIGVSGGSTETVVHLGEDGRGLERVGRAGEGPGEFRSISRLFLTDDRVAVWDVLQDRLSFFERTGQLDSVVPVDGDARVLGLAPGGGFFVDREAEQPSGPVARSFTLETGGNDPARALESVREPAESDVRFDFVLDGRSVGMNTSLPSDCVPRLYAGTLGDRVVLADASDGRLWMAGAGGARRELLRTEDGPVVTAATHDRIRRWFESLESSVRSPRPDPAGRMVTPGEVVFPTEPLDSALAVVGEIGDPLAVWDGLLTDPSGRIWLRDVDCRPSPEVRRWSIVDLEGGRVGSVDVPSTLRLLAVRGRRA